MGLLLLTQDEKITNVTESNKVVSIVFVDIVRSTELITHNPAVTSRKCINNILDIITKISIEFGGEVMKTLGDGVKIGFGVNSAVENHAQQAVYAALKMIRECRETTENFFPHVAYKGLRIGVHSGYVLLTGTTGENNPSKDTFGITTHIAAKLQANAPINHICFSETSQKLLKGILPSKRHELISVGRGIDPIPSFKISALDFQGNQFDNLSLNSSIPMVGRQTEFSEIKNLLSFDKPSNEASVLISGEAGLGKTRLIEEISHNLTARAVKYILTKGLKVMENTPFYSIRQILKNVNIDEYKLEPSEKHALVILKSMDLLAISNWRLGEGDKVNAIFYGTLKVMKQMMDLGPVVLIMEDLHYLDKESLRFLSKTIEFSKEQQTFKIIGSIRSPLPLNLEKIFDLHYELSPLNSSDSAKLIQLISETFSLKENISAKEGIILKSDGNPLTITEFAKLEITESRNIQKPIIPVPIEPILRKRLEYISTNARLLVNYLCLFGRSLTLLQAQQLMPFNDADLSEMILEIIEMGIIKYTGEDEFDFTHDLYRVVCIESLTGSQKKILHEKIYTVLRDVLDSKNTASDKQLLARHAFKSGHLEEGLDYSKAALSIANNIGAIRTVRDLFLEVCDYCDMCEHSDFHKVRFAMLSFDATQRLAEEGTLLDIYLNGLKTSKNLFSPSELIVLKTQLSIIYWTSGQASEGLVYASDAVNEAKNVSHLGLESITIYSLACIEFALGFLESSIIRIKKHVEKIPRELDSKKWGQSVSYPSIVLKTFGAWYAVDAGKFDLAEQYIKDAIETEKKFPNTYGNVLTKNAQGYFFYRRSNFKRSATILYDAYLIAQTSALSLAPMSAAWAALSLIELDDVKTAQTILTNEEKSGRYDILKNANRGYFFLAKSKVFSKLGEHVEAHNWLQMAIKDTSESGDLITLAYSYAAYEEIDGQSNQVGTAKVRYLKNAIQIAKECGMTPLQNQCEEKLLQVSLGKM